jgi:hypothetical protein
MVFSPFRDKQKTCPIANPLLGQEKIPAVPPGLALLRPLYAYYHTLTLGNGGSAPAHILCKSISDCPWKSIRLSCTCRITPKRGSLQGGKKSLLTLPQRFTSLYAPVIGLSRAKNREKGADIWEKL